MHRATRTSPPRRRFLSPGPIVPGSFCPAQGRRGRAGACPMMAGYLPSFRCLGLRGCRRFDKGEGCKARHVGSVPVPAHHGSGAPSAQRRVTTRGPNTPRRRRPFPHFLPWTVIIAETRNRTRLLADDPIPVGIAHVPIRWMRARDRRDAVPTGLLAGDPAVAIVVVAREGIITGGRTASGLTR